MYTRLIDNSSVLNKPVRIRIIMFNDAKIFTGRLPLNLDILWTISRLIKA